MTTKQYNHRKRVQRAIERSISQLIIHKIQCRKWNNDAWPQICQLSDMNGDIASAVSADLLEVYNIRERGPR